MSAKLSAKVQEEVEFLEHVLKICVHLSSMVEQYASSKTKSSSDMYLSQITRALTQLRQNAMMKNLGFVADAAGILGVAAGRGSQVMRTRVLREGSVSLKQLVERTMKAAIDAGHRENAEKEKVHAAEMAAAAAAKPTEGAD
ncbi:MAG: hypothetical protein ACHQU8_04335 [Gemmatimonadales bacterium]